MYATIRKYSGSELATALIDHEDAVKSLLSAVPGFRAYYLVDTPDGTTTVTVCDDQAGVEESNRVAAEWVRENLADLAIAAPTISAGEVKIGF